jgi:hypothetical protein
VEKHKIFKYSGRWYFTCAWCHHVDVVPMQTWEGAFYVGREHIDFKHQDLLTQPVRV